MKIMKKNWIRMIAGAMSIACMMSLTACGGSSTSSTADTSSVVSEEAASSEVVESEAADVANEDAPYANVEEMLADETVADAMKEALASMESDNLTMEIAGEGNCLVYTFTYIDLGDDVDVEAMGDALNEAMDSVASVFEGLAESIGESVQEANPSIRVIYQTEDGTELLNQEYSAN